MKASRVFVLLLVAGSALLHADTNSLPQRILYVGHRAAEFESLLTSHFKETKFVARESFQPAVANDFDVVLLDWPQSGAREGAWEAGSPLGKRADWRKPTVLLGSAGLNLAVNWQLKGGSGCTCLAPVAYQFADHPIFRSPLKIDIHATTNIPTPRSFAEEIKQPTIAVIPLVNGRVGLDGNDRNYQAGWSTHYYEFT